MTEHILNTVSSHIMYTYTGWETYSERASLFLLLQGDCEEKGVDFPGITGLGYQLVISNLNIELDSNWSQEWFPEFS